MLKGRKFIIILLLGMTGLVLLSSVSVPIQFSSRAKVPYSLDRTMDQFRSTDQLAKWFLKNSDEDKVEVISSKPGTIEMEVETEEMSREYSIHISADPANRKHCIVDLSVYRTIWKRWFDPDPTDELVVASLKELEAFTNDTQRFYGYAINKEQITDSCYLFMTAHVTDSTKAMVTKQLFDSLSHYIQTQEQDWNGRRIFYEQPGDSSQLNIFTGTVVTCSMPTSAALGIGQKKLPSGKEQLTAVYEGPYKDIHLVYKAMDQYRKDYSLVGLMLPFEDFLSPGYGYAPDDTVKIKICLPVL
ncbi:hypothetical protein L0U88_16130 [Flavihumibacter sp. RY-1]|uniref:Effector-binding domain-containing protein n=1 Tax=Flavihumibacter fluminis TaxID=2909236 RepID=A0ABS9BLG7_9BACT|nr:hypothetical protein [Flavihumibacter fluminis]MCF1716170.1 hypothetical protein [Flavihumibacter fluminis]